MLRACWPWKRAGKQAVFAFAGERPEELRELTARIERGELAATVDEAFPLERAAEAHRRVEAEQRQGSIVLRVSGAPVVT